MVLASVIRQTLHKRIPMIRFRKGGMDFSADNVIAASIVGGKAAAAGAAPNSKNPHGTITLPTIEDWQLPRRYWRRDIDDKEIEYINRGGPE